MCLIGKAVYRSKFQSQGGEGKGTKNKKAGVNGRK